MNKLSLPSISPLLSLFLLLSPRMPSVISACVPAERRTGFRLETVRALIYCRWKHAPEMERLHWKMGKRGVKK